MIPQHTWAEGKQVGERCIRNSFSVHEEITSKSAFSNIFKLQLKKLVPVHKVADFKREDKNVIFKEMALLKVVGNNLKREKALKACKKFNAVILDKSNKSVVIQITALRRDIDLMSKNLKKFGLVSVSRTGAVAMTRGAEIFK